MTAALDGARPDARPTRRCTRPTRTGRDAPDRVFASLDDDEYERQVVAWCARAAVGRRGARRRAAPAPPDADPRGGGARRAGRAGRRPPARHRAADARGDRGRPRPLGARGGVGGADARLGGRLRARDRAVRDAGRARGGAARARPRALRAGAERLRPGRLRAAPRRPRRALAPPPGRRAARLGAGRAARLGRATTRPTSPRSPTTQGETPVLLYVGRFTEVKRLPLLIEAYARARPGFARRAPLVIVGGFPGEWEGEHPLEAIERVGARDVFLAGWHGHDELPAFLAASDVVVLPSVREQFGQVLVEGMACGAAGDRRRRLGAGRHRQPRRDRLAGRARRRRLAGQRARPRGQLPGRAARGAARARRPRSRASATRGRRWPLEVAAVYDAAVRSRATLELLVAPTFVGVDAAIRRADRRRRRPPRRGCRARSGARPRGHPAVDVARVPGHHRVERAHRPARLGRVAEVVAHVGAHLRADVGGGQRGEARVGAAHAAPAGAAAREAPRRSSRPRGARSTRCVSTGLDRAREAGDRVRDVEAVAQLGHRGATALRGTRTSHCHRLAERLELLRGGRDLGLRPQRRVGEQRARPCASSTGAWAAAVAGRATIMALSRERTSRRCMGTSSTHSRPGLKSSSAPGPSPSPRNVHAPGRNNVARNAAVERGDRCKRRINLPRWPRTAAWAAATFPPSRAVRRRRPSGATQCLACHGRPVRSASTTRHTSTTPAASPSSRA